MLGRAAKLERLGLADPVGPACWSLKPGIEQTLRQLGSRGDIIKTMHRAMSAGGHEPEVSTFALHGEEPSGPVLGKLVKRGLDDELRGSAYAIVAGIDGRTHHLRFNDIELTGDAPTGAIVEARAYDDGLGFRLVPWRPALEKELGREVRGVVAPGGNVEWSLGRKRGLGL